MNHIVKLTKTVLDLYWLLLKNEPTFRDCAQWRNMRNMSVKAKNFRSSHCIVRPTSFTGSKIYMKFQWFCVYQRWKKSVLEMREFCLLGAKKPWEILYQREMSHQPAYKLWNHLHKSSFLRLILILVCICVCPQERRCSKMPETWAPSQPGLRSNCEPPDMSTGNWTCSPGS